MSSSKSGRLKAGTYGNQTFQSLQEEYNEEDPTDPDDPVDPLNPEDPTDPRHTPRLISVKPAIAKLCQLGEMDAVQAAKDCQVKHPLIVTVLDNEREQLLGRYDISQSLEALMVAITAEAAATVKGPEINIFICIDSNGNARCADEPLLDINQLTADILAGNQALLCGKLAKGMLLYHRYHVFSGTGSQVGGAVQSVLNNITEPPYMNDNVTVFPLTLVKAKPKAECPQMNLRTNGCFVKGTKIALTKTMSAPVEALNAGMEVLRADGRTARIARIVAGPESQKVIRIRLESGESVAVTSEHPMATKNGIKPAHKITLADELAVKGGAFRAIRSIGREEYEGTVYNFELEGGTADKQHMVIADGVVTGDLFLQNKISKPAEISPRALTSR